MKRLYQILLLSFILPVVAVAQENQAKQSFTLEQCIQYALDNSNAVKNAAIDQEIASAKVKETTGIGLPQISGNVGVQHNQKLPRFFSQYHADSPAGIVDLSQIPGIKDGDVVAFPNVFQLPSAGNATVSATEVISFSYFIGLRAANTYRELSAKSARQTKEKTIEQVTKAFYNVLINKDRMQLFDVNLARVESLLKTTKAMNENGFAESIDVDRITVTANNLRAQRDNFYNLQELGLQLLKFQMNYPMNDPINIEGNIALLQIDENLLNNYSINWDYKQRSDYSLLQTNRELQVLNLKSKYAESLPSLVATANYGYTTQSSNVSGLFKTNSTGIESTKAYGPDKWYNITSFGLSLNVPIFSGLQRTYRIQQARLSLQQIENNASMLKSAIDLEIKQSAITYLNAINSLKAQNENKSLAENVARVTSIKYEQGVGSNIEVINAESSLREAQVNYYSALYDALVSKVDLDKAYGKLLPQNAQTK
jgi:outer membrane protein